MSEPPLHSFIDMEAYDVVPGELHRRLRDQLGIAAVALGRIADLQPQAVAKFREVGIVFDRAPNDDPLDWQNIAFWVYTDLCETTDVAREALLRMREIETAEASE